MSRKAKSKSRVFGEPPANYPVPSAWIPDMPIETFHLQAFGRITPDDCRLFGFHGMRCAYCAGPTTLVWLHEPLGPDFFADERRAERVAAGTAKKSIPGTVWGTDVLVLCPCCCTPACPHCWKRGVMQLGHDLDGDRCRRCERRGLSAAA